MQFVSVDVGTQSVRAALVTDKGRFLKTASRPLELWNPRPGFYQQSSDQIWNACCDAVKEVCREATDVSGIGFDATCSLVVLDDSGRPLTVSPKGNSGFAVDVDFFQTHVISASPTDPPSAGQSPRSEEGDLSEDGDAVIARFCAMIDRMPATSEERPVDTEDEETLSSVSENTAVAAALPADLGSRVQS
ncbi:hypothetical protein HPB49_017594 [Dermacentor silvarum]|uniref:Uncharacterized protein n=1 Tax=Dermacentor silvarum TaxID=543639 RepID=A0ACB8DJS0_DERSI|nr:hypothetical protein HPB49_017594 [Dermacentor silvarum]